jgi:hypothetical protein
MAMSSVAAMFLAVSQSNGGQGGAPSNTYTKDEIDSKLESLGTGGVEFEDSDIDFSNF